MTEYTGRCKYKCAAPYCPNVYLTDITDGTYENKHFHKFPTNRERRRKWYDAIRQSCQCNIDFDDRKTYHLCNDHFDVSAFTSTLQVGIHRTAVPSIFLSTPARPEHNIERDMPSTSTTEIANTDFRDMPSTSTGITETQELQFDDSKNFETHKRHKRKNTSTPKSRKRLRFDFLANSDAETCSSRKTYPTSSILGSVGVKHVSELTPRKQKLYYANKTNKMRIAKLKQQVRTSRLKAKTNSTAALNNVFNIVANKLNPTGVGFLRAQYTNAKRKRYVWNRKNKIFALALYKRSARAYRFLQKFVLLPSRTTLMKCLRNLPFDTGINTEMCQRLKKRFEKLPELDKYVSVIFDEIQLSMDVKLCRATKKIIGYVDLGAGKRKNVIAKHALVFMIQGLHRKFKQPFAYYFTEHTVPAEQLQQIIIDIITALQNITLKPVAVVCDQGATNRKAINKLLNGNKDAFFLVNNQKIFAIYDPPHLLKNTRNALFKYFIAFAAGKLAKFKYIVQCFEIDRRRRFQTLRKIRAIFFKLDGFNPYKMKVSVAAKTLSYTVASAIEAICSCSNLLPAEAVYTAEFIGEIDQLFDSLNGSGTFKNHLKPLLQPLSDKSRHLLFWNEMLPKISRWKFIDSNGVSKNHMPFKEGWIQTITAVKGLWRFLQSKGFRFLRTRALNQDPVENLFANIRQYGAANVRPSCYQFISALKTAVLNNLVARQSKGANCQEDDGHLLDNLESFLGDDSRAQLAEPLPVDNELLGIPLPEYTDRLDDANFDSQGITYVCGYLAKKLNLTNCATCCDNLTTQDVLQQHTFVLFREYDTKKRLFYASPLFVVFLAKAYDIINYLLSTNGHCLNVEDKLLEVLSTKVDFSWFTCLEHKEALQKEIISSSVSLLINKFCEDRRREMQTSNRIPHKTAGVNKVKHLS